MSKFLYNVAPYNPPSWLPSSLNQITDRLSLGRWPTPIHRCDISPFVSEGLDVDFWLKRDDLSSFDLSGNKVRKLEFLLAECLKEGKDCVITIGGIQSNHARATAAAARQIGLDSYLILRTNLKPDAIGVEGNLLVDRAVGSSILCVTPAEYARVGSTELTRQLADRLRQCGKNPFIIPVGGSDEIGAFGYIDCIQEIIDTGVHFDHIVCACGSGGTATGLAIGIRAAGLTCQLHAVGVCDSPDYFYQHIEDVALKMGVEFGKLGQPRQWLKIYSGQGKGYARSTDEELNFILSFSQRTGIILDPVYSGKALYYWLKEIESSRSDFDGKRMLFIHTGGVLGLYTNAEELLRLLPDDRVAKMKVELAN